MSSVPEIRPARLGRKGVTVVCGWDTCNEVFARVGRAPDVPADQVQQDPGLMWIRAQADYPRILVLQPGIAAPRHKNGVWKRSKKTVQKRMLVTGGRPAFARPPTRGRVLYGDGEYLGLAPRHLPIVVCCPSCERLTSCDPSALKVCSFFALISGRSDNHYGMRAVPWNYDS